MRFFSSRNKTVYLSKAYPFVRFDCAFFSTITNFQFRFFEKHWLSTLNLWLFWFLFCYFYTATCWWQFGCEYFASHGTCYSRKLYYNIKNLRHDNTKGEVTSILFQMSFIPNKSVITVSTFIRIWTTSLKFGHSEKATKIWNNLPLDLTFTK